MIDSGEIDRRLSWFRRRIRDSFDQTALFIQGAVRFPDYLIGTRHERTARRGIGAEVVKNFDCVQLQNDRDQNARSDR